MLSTVLSTGYCFRYGSGLRLLQLVNSGEIPRAVRSVGRTRMVNTTFGAALESDLREPKLIGPASHM